MISPHNSYHAWGSRNVSRLANGVAISLGYDAEDLAPIYEKVERVAIYDCDFCMTWRNHMAIYVARGPKLDDAGLRAVWEGVKHFE